MASRNIKDNFSLFFSIQADYYSYKMVWSGVYSTFNQLSLTLCPFTQVLKENVKQHWPQE